MARGVESGTVKKAGIAGLAGGMGFVFLAFLLEYLRKAREGDRERVER